MNFLFFLSLFTVKRLTASTLTDSAENELDVSHQNRSQITNLLNELVDPKSARRYDKRLRPNYGGKPVGVGVTIHVSSISSVSEVEMDYTLDIYLRQEWADPRLLFNNSKYSQRDLTIGVDYIKSIWVPDTFFPNEKSSFFHTATTHNSFLRISPHGTVKTSQRLTVTATCPMDLKLFPLDTQACRLELESYGYSMTDIIYHWGKDDKEKDDDDSVKYDDFKLPQFAFGGKKISTKIASLSTGNYSRLICLFKFSRSLGFYLIQIYLPSSLIVIISWVSFWLSRDATPARVSLGVTTVLTMTTLMATTNSAMPKVSYIKSIDVYLITCFLLVFATLIEYATVGYLNKKIRMRREQNVQSHKSIGPMLYQMRSSVPGAHANPHQDYEPHRERPPPIYASTKNRRYKGQSSNTSRDNFQDCLSGSSGMSPWFNKIAPDCTCDENDDSQTTFNGLLQQSGPPIVVNPAQQSKQGSKKRKARGYMAAGWLDKNPGTIDKYSRIVFPLFFFIFNLLYWGIYYSVSEQRKNFESDELDD